MKIIAYLMVLILSTFIPLLGPSPVFAEEKNTSTSKFELYERSIEIQYLTSELKDEDDPLVMQPIFLKYGFKINSFLNLDDHKGTIQLILSPFLAPITRPTPSISFGVGISFQYTYPLGKKISLYSEAGVAPMYLGVNTVEQGKAGFNFLDQGGGGFRFQLANDQIITIGYKRSHISNLDFRDANTGIDGHAGVISLTKSF